MIGGEQQLGRVVDILNRSTASGARIAAGGTHEGRFFRPTVLTGVTPATAAFAPCAASTARLASARVPSGTWAIPRRKGGESSRG